MCGAKGVQDEGEWEGPAKGGVYRIIAVKHGGGVLQQTASVCGTALAALTTTARQPGGAFPSYLMLNE